MMFLKRDEILMLQVRGPKLNVDLYDPIFSYDEADYLFQHLMILFDPDKRQRQTAMFGYTFIESPYGEMTDWSECPILLPIKEALEKITEVDHYHYCVIQFYPTGSSHIRPHRDREVGSKAVIAGISIGAKRTFRLTPPYWMKNESPVDLELLHGSLYVMLPPTNDHWLHSIEPVKDKSAARISLTFRHISPSQ